MYLEAEKVYGCARCKVHLTEINEIISKSFQGRHGKAYLFNKLINRINIIHGPLEDRVLLTGLHTVCDIYCMFCQSQVGWKYVSYVIKQERAYDPSQKYKEGKYILERPSIKKLDWI